MGDNNKWNKELKPLSKFEHKTLPGKKDTIKKEKTGEMPSMSPQKRKGTPFKLRGGTGNRNSYAAFQNKGLISPMQNGEGDLKKKMQEQVNKQAQQEMQKKEFDESGKKRAEVTKTASTTRGTGKGYEERWNEMSDAERSKFKDLSDFEQKSEAYHKSKDITVTGVAEDKQKKTPPTTTTSTKKKIPTDPVTTKVKDNRVITGYKGERIDGKLVKTPIYADASQRIAQKGGEGDAETGDVSGVGVVGQQKHKYKEGVEGETTKSALQKKDPTREIKRKSRKKTVGQIKGEGYDVLKGKF